MRKIDKAFCHLNLETFRTGKVKDWSKPFRNDEIISSEPMKVQTYDELVGYVARILHYNREHVIYFRGQGIDYRAKGKSTVLPSIYRNKPGEKVRNIKPRFLKLLEKSNEFIEWLDLKKVPFAGTHLVKKYPEIAWTILQHYEVCDTPLLDVTHSLHVACSFALLGKSNGESGIIYLLGLPWQTDAIGYDSFQELVNLRLLSVCPPSAKRPFFQEGYLAGPFPNYKLNESRRIEQFDFNRRILAKFEIICCATFWGDGFEIIPYPKLMQDNDPFTLAMNDLKK